MRVEDETVTVQICRYDSPRELGAEPRPMTASLVSLGNERWVWSPLLATCDDPEYPAVAELMIVTPANDGRPRAVRVDVRSRDGSSDVDSEVLRIPVAAIVRNAIEQQADHGPDAAPGTLPGAGQVFTYGSTVEPVKLPRRSHVARTDERLRQVVEVHNAAPWGKRGEAVAKEFGVSVNTARNLVSEARRRGLFEKKEQQ
jgi:hypothetical protein